MAKQESNQRQQPSGYFEPKLEWCQQGDWPKWRQPPSAVLWQKPKSTTRSAGCYFKLMQAAVERFFHLTPTERLDELIAYLERQKKKKDTQLAKRLRDVVAALATIDDDWDADGVADDAKYHVDLYVEMMSVRYLYATLHQLNVEGLFSCTPLRDAPGLKGPMRVAAGLPRDMSKATDDFIMDVHSSLIATPRKQRNKVTPGGAKSALRDKADMLCFWYERLHQIWRHSKAIYKKHDDERAGKEAVLSEYRTIFAGENSKAIYREKDGLPEELIDRLGASDPYESSPEYLAYEHAAFMCGFEIGKCSVKQIKRVIGDYKKSVNAYYELTTVKKGK